MSVYTVRSKIIFWNQLQELLACSLNFDMFDQASGANVFRMLDISSANFNISVDKILS